METIQSWNYDDPEDSNTIAPAKSSVANNPLNTDYDAVALTLAKSVTSDANYREASSQLASDAANLAGMQSIFGNDAASIDTGFLFTILFFFIKVLKMIFFPFAGRVQSSGQKGLYILISVVIFIVNAGLISYAIIAILHATSF